MKASEAKAISHRTFLLKTVLPEIYKKIREATEKGETEVNIGKPSFEVHDILKADGYNVFCGEDDGDPHSSRCLYYVASWK